MNDGKICISICAETAAELVEQIKRAEDLADVIEIRFDCLSQLHFGKFLSELKNLKKNLLVTFRPKEQGGKRDLSLSERRKFWQLILTFSNVVYFDIEPDLQKKFPDLKINSRIASFHNFGSSINDFENIYNELVETGSGILKIAVQTDDITDTIPVWKLLEKARADGKKIIPIAMGESGKWTRILGLAHGAFMTYAALDAGRETAPGQVSAKDLTEVYRAKELDENTEIYGIIGGNTSYSMSPYIHNAAFKFHQLNAVFVPLQMQNLDEFISRMVRPETREIDLNFKGFAVTIPHKQRIIKHLDFIDETAEKIGAVNTVKITDGKLYGSNTDAHGFIEPLKNAYGDLKNVNAAILGAGGAARACLYALKTVGAKVTIFARDTDKAKSLAEEFQADLQELKTQNSKLETFQIVVNATPLGTKGELENETPATGEQLKNIHLAYDLVYNPFETRFLCEARSANVPTIGGMAMLVAQAMQQQKIWTGLDAPMTEISRAVLKRLK